MHPKHGKILSTTLFCDLHQAKAFTPVPESLIMSNVDISSQLEIVSAQFSANVQDKGCQGVDNGVGIITKYCCHFMFP